MWASSGSRHKHTVCKSPFPSAGTAVSLFCVKTVQQRPLLLRVTAGVVSKSLAAGARDVECLELIACNWN